MEGTERSIVFDVDSMKHVLAYYSLSFSCRGEMPVQIVPRAVRRACRSCAQTSIFLYVHMWCIRVHADCGVIVPVGCSMLMVFGRFDPVQLPQSECFSSVLLFGRINIVSSTDIRIVRY